MVEPWPLEGLLTGHPLAQRWKDEWELLGFCSGPPLLSLVRPLLPASLSDSRALRELIGKTVRLAGLLSSAQEEGGPTRLSLEDEYGVVEVKAPSGKDTADPAVFGSVMVVEGQAEERYGAPVIVAATLARPLPVVPGALGAVPIAPVDGRIAASPDRAPSR